MGLVDIDFTLEYKSFSFSGLGKEVEGCGNWRYNTDPFCHVVEVLATVDTRVLWSGPGGSVDCSSAVPRTREGLPVDKKRDGILGLGDTIVGLSRSDAGGSAGNNSSRNCPSLEEPTAYIDVVR